MIKVSNITRHDGLSFENYLKLPGYSFSFLSREQAGIASDVEKTDAMELGKLVDGILTSPEEVSPKHPMYSDAKEIARYIKTQYGKHLALFETQVSYTATFHYDVFSLQVRGRLDYLLPGLITLDLKVTSSTNVPALISHMGYENQVWGYAKMAGTPDGLILAYLRRRKICEVHRVPIGEHNDFWADKIMRFGTVSESQQSEGQATISIKV